MKNKIDYIFLKACRGEAVPYTPIWLMRQAGRYMSQYQQIREKMDFLTLCKTPEMAAKVTLQPVDVLGVDAAILFSDILTLIEAMGLELTFAQNEGPIIGNPVRSYEYFHVLTIPDPEESLGYVMETIRLLMPQLEGRVPLIGFSGAPFTLATYIIEGGSSKQFIETKTMMYQDPELFKALMNKIAHSVTLYLKAQIRAGAQAVQLFDTWAGVLSPADYVMFVLPQVKSIISELKKLDVPVIYFVNNCSGLLEHVKTCGADVLSFDWRIGLADAINRVGKSFVVQGNLDPCILFGPVSLMESYVRQILDDGTQAKRHIFNLGHGILPQTPVDHVKALVDMVHRISERL